MNQQISPALLEEMTNEKDKRERRYSFFEKKKKEKKEKQGLILIIISSLQSLEQQKSSFSKTIWEREVKVEKGIQQVTFFISFFSFGK